MTDYFDIKRLLNFDGAFVRSQIKDVGRVYHELTEEMGSIKAKWLLTLAERDFNDLARVRIGQPRINVTATYEVDGKQYTIEGVA